MPKKFKFFISLILFFLIVFNFLPKSFAKYVIENTSIVARLNIDRCKPNIELIDIKTSNNNSPTYANKSHIISGHIKITEKNIVKNLFSQNTIQIFVNANLVSPTFINFSLESQSKTEKIYSFSFTNVLDDGNLIIVVPTKIIEDKSRIN